MPNESQQLRLRLNRQCQVTLSAHQERELIDALSELLRAAAGATEVQNRAEGEQSDEQQDQ